ncbi:uncharacterized protein EV420DRAFT_1255439, partial [Desarmillaria tabescens]
SRQSMCWNQNLICPSLILPKQWQKGCFHSDFCSRDQLWTNTGMYKTPKPGDEFPLDLGRYLEPSQGWMNEGSVHIDMMHCHLSKAPLQSALK